MSNFLLVNFLNEIMSQLFHVTFSFRQRTLKRSEEGEAQELDNKIDLVADNCDYFRNVYKLLFFLFFSYFSTFHPLSLSFLFFIFTISNFLLVE
jgi:hypothetical protein